MKAPQYMVVHGSMPIICLPIDIDQDNFIDVTSISDSYRKYLDTQTGKVHDCEVYFKQAMQEIENELA